jgi:hypothetical protein
VQWIGHYLAATKDEGITYKPINKSFNIYVDADFARNWSKDSSAWDIKKVRSRAGYIITYAGCPIYWSSRLMTELALSTMEVEFIAVSESLQQVIPMMQLITELKDRGFGVNTLAPNCLRTIAEQLKSYNYQRCAPVSKTSTRNTTSFDHTSTGALSPCTRMIHSINLPIS